MTSHPAVPFRTGRRQLLKGLSAVAASTLYPWSTSSAAVAPWLSTPDQPRSDDQPLRLAVIGVANRGANNLDGVRSQSIVALCDVDRGYLDGVGQQFPDAKRYQDYRKLLDEVSDLDGVVISTPDHHHAPAAIRALRRGLHVYCEKPLTHTVAEARMLAKAARDAGVATQMGTQIHAEPNYRRVVEIVRAGILGPIHRVHVWVGKGWGAAEMPQPAGIAPANLDWDLWLGPAPLRPYTPNLHPANWRRYRDFGTGTLGDMGCHYMDLPFWALGLGSPLEIRAEGPPSNRDCCPLGLKVHYQFASTDAHPELELIWYDGDLTPRELEGIGVPGAGVLFVGEKGILFGDYSRYQLYPADQFQSFQPPAPSIAPSPGHYVEWFQACRGGSPALCNFDYSGPLTECVLLGTVSHQVGRTLRWKAEQLTCQGDDEATALIHKTNRDGWIV